MEQELIRVQSRAGIKHIQKEYDDLTTTVTLEEIASDEDLGTIKITCSLMLDMNG
jgi:hypothetical protein